MQIAVVQFPGSNCERETIMAIQRAGMQAVEFLWNESSEKLAQCDGFVLVGGFSYEDRGRAGIIAALDPVMQAIKLQSELGKPVLGICNGAQILVETGLVPGIENNKVAMALTENKRVVNGVLQGTGYYNQWVHMRLTDHYQRNAFTKYLTENNVLQVPIAHAEGRFVMPHALYLELNEQGLNLFQYCDNTGEIAGHFPINPNGSMGNIAAIANKAGNVLAMMPHPERTSQGDAIFASMRDYIADNHFAKVAPLSYYPRPEVVNKYQPKNNNIECLVELMITDNHAITVQNTLEQLGLSVKVRRFIHWEIACDDNATPAILKSGVLFNERKEKHIKEPVISNHSFSYLVREKENLQGMQKMQMLKDHYGLSANQIVHGVLWHFTTTEKHIDEIKKAILSTHIIQNPYAYDYFEYATNAG